ncbi:fimbrial protein [Hafnia paralvei]|uniref:fimbrial protein n=1 Tax=Hafnia paralvei TaxID=546367 RepID=UPI0026DBAEE4|nr:fimbrial protein [Hafnia paralvei]MDX6910591.1 fimbrial protein [Hafnia paralvei]
MKHILRQLNVAGMMTLILMVVGIGACRADSQVDFDGTLIEDPCTLAVGTQGSVQTVDFGTVINKYLYANTRSPVQTFTILLQDCDTSLGKTVSFIFHGTEDAAQPGLLALDPTSGAQGIAIGLASADGTPLSINEESGTSTLNDGDTQISFQAYVQASQAAIVNNAIVVGEFSATATFEMVYE